MFSVGLLKRELAESHTWSSDWLILSFESVCSCHGDIFVKPSLRDKHRTRLSAWKSKGGVIFILFL